MQPMKLLSYLLLTTVFISVTFASEQVPNKASGILVQVKDKAVLSSKEFKKLIKKSGLSPKRFYPSLKVQSFSLALKDDKKIDDLNSLCTKIIKSFPRVTTCELNLPLSPNSNPEPTPCASSTFNVLDLTNTANIDQLITKAQDPPCDLFVVKSDKHDYRLVSNDPTRTPFWAQEYVGSDLLKEEMAQRGVDTSATSSLLAIWDSYKRNHGEHVANLIAGPFESSLVTLSTPQDFINLQETEDYIGAYERNLEKCNNKSNCPRFINNSMKWHNSDLVRQTVEKLTFDHGTIFVTSADNEYSKVDYMKSVASEEGYSILVTSHAPNGLSSVLTSFDSEVDITAPSDHSILSFNHSGKLHLFGGTSGASPLVTTSLLAFELIAGVKLSTPQFKELLKKTAIRHVNDPPRSVTGAGYLNSYKIGALAFKLVSLCDQQKEKSQRDDCMLNSLEKDDLYDFSKDLSVDAVIENFETAFPKCGGPSESDQAITCEDKKKALKELRKASLLIPENLQLWGKLACISRLAGFSTNAEYYERLSKGKRFNEMDLTRLANADLVDILTPGNDRQLILEVLKKNGLMLEYASEALRNDREFVLEAVKNSGGYALQYASEALRNDREFVLQAVKNSLGLALEFYPEALRNDREIVLEAVKNHGIGIQYASEALKNDREIVLEAVKNIGWALQYASKALRNDREIVLEAAKYNRWTLEYASDALRNDPEIKAAAGIK